MKKDSVFPIVVLSFSTLEIIDALFGQSNLFGLLNSIIGILGVSLYFLKNDKYRQLINVWIYLQFILITKTVVDPDTSLTTVFPIFDLTQFFRIKLGFAFIFDSTSYSTDFNFLPLVYLYVFKKLQTRTLIGRQLNLKLYRDNVTLNDSLPQTTTVLDIIDFSKNEDWIALELSIPIVHNEIKYQYGLIKAKDDIPILINKKTQMAHLRLVENLDDLKTKRQLNNFDFIDWVNTLNVAVVNVLRVG